MPNIEYDSRKDAINRAKHGIALGRAEEFDWSEAVIKADTRRDYGEQRFVATGPLEGRLHVLVFTRRGEAIRIVGLRKANARERKRYAAEKTAAAH